MPKVKTANVAGSFYPSSKEELEKFFKIILEYSEQKQLKIDKEIKAIISPHAGIMYSGFVAGVGYNLLSLQKFQRAIILGPSHYYPLDYIALLDYDFYKTPLGEIKIDKDFQTRLVKDDHVNFKIQNEAHKKEHSVEMQIIFAQRFLKNIKIIPMVVGQIDFLNSAQTLNKFLDKETLVVVSSDLSHYHHQELARELDNNSINAILSKDTEKIKSNADACGIYPILVLNEIAKLNNWEPRLIDYMTSGDVTGDTSAVVGYSCIAYT